MILVDTALERREREGRPIRVGMVGAGAMARMIALQVTTVTPGMEIVAIANRRIERARDAYALARRFDARAVDDLSDLTAAIAAGVPAVTDDPSLLCAAEEVDVILEVTGAVEFGAHVVMEAIARGKHVVTMNAELQGTVGPLLFRHAQDAGVVLTDSDGDQPGVIMNLFRFVKGIGVRPVLLGNMKGLQDEYRNPTTQEGFARRAGLSAHMATSFADGTKMSFEMALVANATGMRVRDGGMLGPACDDVEEAKGHWDLNELLDGPGLVDYVVGARPAPGVFVLGFQDQPDQKHWLAMYKLGDGPLYTFYTPYHLCHLEVPTTVGRAMDFHDDAVAPHFGHVVDVVTRAKTHLAAGDLLDGIGFYRSYGVGVNAEEAMDGRLLPMGISEGCRLTRDIEKDAFITYDDVEVPGGRLIDELRHQLVSTARVTP
jgi:predicted homoserine dehydrogenase-like protein